MADTRGQRWEVTDEEPCYVISIAARMLGVHQQTLRYYERMGIIEPSRSQGNIRLYSPADINRLRDIKQLMADFGVNPAGAEMILKYRALLRQMESEIAELRQQLSQATAELEKLRSR